MACKIERITLSAWQNNGFCWNFSKDSLQGYIPEEGWRFHLLNCAKNKKDKNTSLKWLKNVFLKLSLLLLYEIKYYIIIIVSMYKIIIHYNIISFKKHWTLIKNI